MKKSSKNLSYTEHEKGSINELGLTVKNSYITDKNSKVTITKTPYKGGVVKLTLQEEVFLQDEYDTFDFPRTLWDKFDLHPISQKEGSFFMCDIAESVVLKKIKEESLPAAKFYLTHNDKRYAPKRALDPQELVSPIDQMRLFIVQLLDKIKRMSNKEEIRGIEVLAEYLKKEVAEYDDRTQSDIQKKKMFDLMKKYLGHEE